MGKMALSPPPFYSVCSPTKTSNCKNNNYMDLSTEIKKVKVGVNTKVKLKGRLKFRLKDYPKG